MGRKDFRTVRAGPSAYNPLPVAYCALNCTNPTITRTKRCPWATSRTAWRSGPNLPGWTSTVRWSCPFRHMPGGIGKLMRVLRIGLVIGLLFTSSHALPTAVRAAGDVGVEGLSYAGAAPNPTGEKPESKLWFNDGRLVGKPVGHSELRYEIFRFDLTGTGPRQMFRSTLRSNSRADTLWVGTKLYVASHVFS